tara:strand:- start:256 stop:639 length:384 start_codon:yes stop_codon:yes gene_type:complete
MATTYKNITTTADGTDLISRVTSSDVGVIASGTKKIKNPGAIKKITICNVDDQTAVDVSVYIEDAAEQATTHANNNKYHLINDVDIPVGATLVLDDNVNYDGTVYALRIDTTNAADGGAGKLSVIIK